LPPNVAHPLYSSYYELQGAVLVKGNDADDYDRSLTSEEADLVVGKLNNLAIERAPRVTVETIEEQLDGAPMTGRLLMDFDSAIIMLSGMDPKATLAVPTGDVRNLLGNEDVLKRIFDEARKLSLELATRSSREPREPNITPSPSVDKEKPGQKAPDPSRQARPAAIQPLTAFDSQGSRTTPPAKPAAPIKETGKTGESRQREPNVQKIVLPSSPLPPQSPWLREVLANLRDGKTVLALKELRESGYVVEYATAKQAQGDVVKAWAEELRAGREALLVGMHPETVRELNSEARRAVRDFLGEEKTYEAAGGRLSVAVGEVVIAGQPGPKGTESGDRLRVIEHASGTVLLCRRMRDNERITWDTLTHRQIDYGYAVMSTQSSGKRVDSAYILAERGESREAALVDVTGARLVRVAYGRDRVANVARLYAIGADERPPRMPIADKVQRSGQESKPSVPLEKIGVSGKGLELASFPPGGSIDLGHGQRETGPGPGLGRGAPLHPGRGEAQQTHDDRSDQSDHEGAGPSAADARRRGAVPPVEPKLGTARRDGEAQPSGGVRWKTTSANIPMFSHSLIDRSATAEQRDRINKAFAVIPPVLLEALVRRGVTIYAMQPGERYDTVSKIVQTKYGDSRESEDVLYVGKTLYLKRFDLPTIVYGIGLAVNGVLTMDQREMPGQTTQTYGPPTASTTVNVIPKRGSFAESNEILKWCCEHGEHVSERAKTSPDAMFAETLRAFVNVPRSADDLPWSEIRELAPRAFEVVAGKVCELEVKIGNCKGEKFPLLGSESISPHYPDHRPRRDSLDAARKELAASNGISVEKIRVEEIPKFGVTHGVVVYRDAHFVFAGKQTDSNVLFAVKLKLFKEQPNRGDEIDITLEGRGKDSRGAEITARALEKGKELDQPDGH
jgi:hypothetical protein